MPRSLPQNKVRATPPDYRTLSVRGQATAPSQTAGPTIRILKKAEEERGDLHTTFRWQHSYPLDRIALLTRSYTRMTFGYL